MPDSVVASTNSRSRAAEALLNVRRFAGPPSEFWPKYLECAANLVGAHRAMLVLRPVAEPEKLRKLAEWADGTHADESARLFLGVLPPLISKCSAEKRTVQAVDRTHWAIAVKLDVPDSKDECFAAFLLKDSTEAKAQDAVLLLELSGDSPLVYQRNQAAGLAKQDVEKFACVLDLLLVVNAETRFLAAALAFCNAVATRFNCERVSFGWLERGYVRLKAISRTERFDKNMVAVGEIESAMEEAIDQDEELVYPAPENFNGIVLHHRELAQKQNSGQIASIPLRSDGKPTAILTLERSIKAFSETELQQLRLACDETARRFSDLYKYDRWFGSRWALRTKESLSTVLGPQHTWAKVLAILGVLLLILLFLPIFPYRVQGTFILRSDEVAYLTAPFDGYLRAVDVRPGDIAGPSATLLQLNTEELRLQEAAALADQNRYLREAEKSRATNGLADMRISLALSDQAHAQLEAVRYKLGQAELKSPFSAVVVEGDLRQRIGSPVRQGEPLLKIARIDRFYVEAQINERDVHQILQKTDGQIAFVAQPRLKFPVKVVRIEPSAIPREKENVFQVRCAPVGPTPAWWRPGMSGVAKINVEKRTLFWILTHRTVDFLRLILWW